MLVCARVRVLPDPSELNRKTLSQLDGAYEALRVAAADDFAAFVEGNLDSPEHRAHVRCPVARKQGVLARELRQQRTDHDCPRKNTTTPSSAPDNNALRSGISPFRRRILLP